MAAVLLTYRFRASDQTAVVERSVAIGWTPDQHMHEHKSNGPKGRNWKGPWPKTPGRVLGVSLVRTYQLTLSGFIGNGCRHLPTCSEYAYEAIARHGLWGGGWLGVFRFIRCGPGGTHGVDLVPETLDDDQRWWAPWRLWRWGRKNNG